MLFFNYLSVIKHTAWKLLFLRMKNPWKTKICENYVLWKLVHIQLCAIKFQSTGKTLLRGPSFHAHIVSLPLYQSLTSFSKENSFTSSTPHHIKLGWENSNTIGDQMIMCICTWNWKLIWMHRPPLHYTYIIAILLCMWVMHGNTQNATDQLEHETTDMNTIGLTVSTTISFTLSGPTI